MDLMTWITLLVPIPLCAAISLALKKWLLAYVPRRLHALLPDLLKTTAGPAFIETIKSKGANIEDIQPLIEEHLDHFLEVKLIKEMPVVGMFVGDKTIAQLKQLFMQELELLFPEVMNRYLNTLTAKLATEKFSLESIRSLILPVLSKELNNILLLGTLSGVLISLVQLALFSIGQ